MLYHCVTEYVATGEPVGSRTLSKKAGLDLSPASIRNVLADLEEGGYLLQPHTSAGRVPTDRAFRLFIDALMQVHALTTDEETRASARGSRRWSPGDNVMRETGKLLSELTGTAAVVVAPRAETLVLQHLRFIRTSSDEVLAVLVMNNGAVQNRFLHGHRDRAELQRIHNLLDDVVEGRTLGDLRELFERRLGRRAACRTTTCAGGPSSSAGRRSRRPSAARPTWSSRARTRLLEKPEFHDAGHVRELVTALDARERLVEAARPGDAGQGRARGRRRGGRGPRGRPARHRGRGLHDHGQAAGTVGVIGPTRMDYPKRRAARGGHGDAP